MPTIRRALLPAAALVALTSALTGCMGTVRTTHTARGSSEMLLVSTAAQRAVQRYDARPLAGKRVFVAEDRHESYDANYVRSALREHLARQGVVLVDERAAADVVLEVRSATLGCWDGAWRLGVPPLPFSPPGGGPGDLIVLSPDLTFGYGLKEGWARIQLWLADARTGAYVGSSGDLWGRAYEAIFDDIYPRRIPGADEATGEGYVPEQAETRAPGGAGAPGG